MFVREILKHPWKGLFFTCIKLPVPICKIRFLPKLLFLFYVFCRVPDIHGKITSRPSQVGCPVAGVRT